MSEAVQHRLGHDCALCDAHAKVAKRHAPPPRARTKRYLPWIAPLALSLALTPFVDGVARGLFLGLVVGLTAGAVLTWLTTEVNRHIAARTLASVTDELKAEADQRAAMVIRQFEWAVNDVANLRDALKRAQDARAASEASEHRVRRRLHQLERQLYEARTKIGEYSRALGTENAVPVIEAPVLATADALVVPLTWHVFDEDMLTWLRFESAGIVPSQIRILNEHDSVIAISARSLDTVEEGAQVSLVVRAPDHVIATLEGRHQGRFTFEALVDDTWCKVELTKAKKSLKDKRSRVWRPDDDRRPQSLIA